MSQGIGSHRAGLQSMDETYEPLAASDDHRRFDGAATCSLWLLFHSPSPGQVTIRCLLVLFREAPYRSVIGGFASARRIRESHDESALDMSLD